MNPGAPRTRVARLPVHGMLLLDKPRGFSSNQALQKVKWLLRAQKAGHTGTLDPLATGVLPICLGAATKFSQLQLDADKTYDACLTLGVRTSTGDAEGDVLEQRSVHVEPAQVHAVLASFVGGITQVPPMYSALKHQGRALYDYARAGEVVEREPRAVRIYSIDCLQMPANPAVDALILRVRCSKGTYIRTLAEDIGSALGCGAHLSALRRVATGPFTLNDCVTLEQLQALDDASRLRMVQPVARLLEGVPSVHLEASEAGRLLTGLRRRVALADAALVQVWGPAEQGPARALLGTAHIRSGELIPLRLLTPPEVAQCLEPSS